MKQNNKHAFSTTPTIDDDKYIKIGLSALFIVFGVLGVWSAFAPMDSGVALSGQVVVESNNKMIQHLEGGVVEKIYVHDGDVVNKGDILIKLSQASSESSLLSLQANYYQALALENRLIAENEDKASIVFSKELDSLTQEKKEKLIKTQIEIFENDRSTFEKNKKIASQKIEALEEQIKSLEESIISKEKLKISYEEEAAEQQDLLNQNLIDKTNLREVTRKIESLQSDILSNKTDVQRAKIQINEVQTQLSLDQESFYGKVKDELRKTQTSLDDMNGRMIAIKDMLERTSIAAPVNGTVLNLDVHTIGAVITPGKPIMEIVPEDAKLIIKAQLSTQYIDYAKVGMKANMTFPAFQMKGRLIKNIEGEVIFVAADSTPNKDGESFYTVKLIINEAGKEVLKHNDLEVVAGMPASVTLLIGTQTPLEYLLKPLKMMLDKAFLEE
jgi:epimerase transport system membrane fusion protein